MESPTSYIIYRDAQTDQPFDPTAPLIFFPAKDSDELFDILRAKYPHLKSHSERVREAVIEFLLQEPRMDQLPLPQLPTPQKATASTPSPWQASFPSMCSETSTWSSPDTATLVTPTFPLSPQTPALSRQFSTTTSTTAPSECSPPALEEMTGVFSLCDSSQPKQRIRRKMTEAEKVEYRKRRIVKACDKCAKRKRKCNHNQQDMDTASTKPHKISKPSAAPTTKKPPAANPLKIQELDTSFLENTVDFDDPFATFALDSFDNLDDFDFSLPEMGVDEFLASSQPQWPWSDTADWTLMDQSAISSQQNSPFELERDITTSSDLSLVPLHSRDQSQIFQHNTQGGSGDQVLWEHLRTGQDDLEIHSHLNGTQFIEDSQSNDRDWTLYGRGDDWGEDWAESYVYDSDQRGNWQGRDLLAQLILRLTGTAKAATAFGGLLRQRPPPDWSRSISVDTVAELVQTTLREDTAASDASKNRRLRGDLLLLPDALRTEESSSSRPAKNLSNRNRGKSSSSQPVDQSRSSRPQRAQRSGIESHFADPQQTHNELGKVEPTRSGALQKRDVGSVSTLNPQRVPCTPGLEPHPRNQTTLGEGIASRMSPSTELFMLKRRIPRALHSIVDRNNSVASTTMPLPRDSSALHTQTALDYRREMIISRNTECTEGNATRVNGGAYQRLDSASYNNPAFDALPKSTKAAEPIRNRRRDLHEVQSLGSNADAVTSSASSEANPRLGQYIPQEDRLSDHFRRRDHFGRYFENRLQAMYTLAGLGSVLLLLAFLPRHTTNLSLLLLALASPVRGAKGTHNPRGSQSISEVWGTMLQWITGNSQWASQFSSSYNNAARKDAPRALCSRDMMQVTDGMWHSRDEGNERIVQC